MGRSRSRSRSIVRRTRPRSPIRLSRKSPSPDIRRSPGPSQRRRSPLAPRQNRSKSKPRSEVSRTTGAAPKKKALPPGIIRSEERGDKYIINQDGAEYEVQTAFYCTLCNAQLHSGSIEVHMNSKKHRNKTEYQDDDWEGTSQQSAPPLPMIAASQFQVAGYMPQQPEVRFVPAEAPVHRPQNVFAATGSVQHAQHVQHTSHAPQMQAPPAPEVTPTFPPVWPQIPAPNLGQLQQLVEAAVKNFFEGPGRDIIQSCVQSHMQKEASTRLPPPPPAPRR